MILLNLQPLVLEGKILLDLHYAKNSNVAQVKLYHQDLCYLHQKTWEQLLVAVDLASKINMKIKIFDGYRPLSVQKYLFQKFIDKPGFVSNPDGGVIPHCRGVAIDLTLVDENNFEIPMGTDFDEFSPLAFHNCSGLAPEYKINRLTLLGIMTLAGFDFYRNEWWHYQLMNPRDFPIVDEKKFDLISLV